MNSQRAKLEVIKKVMDRPGLAYLAISTGMISEREWPGAISFCPYPPPGVYAELSLSPAQVEQLERFRRESPISERGRAIAILTDAQKAQLWDFGDEMELAGEAIELHLIPPPVRGGEGMCR